MILSVTQIKLSSPSCIRYSLGISSHQKKKKKDLNQNHWKAIEIFTVFRTLRKEWRRTSHCITSLKISLKFIFLNKVPLIIEASSISLTSVCPTHITLLINLSFISDLLASSIPLPLFLLSFFFSHTKQPLTVTWILFLYSLGCPVKWKFNSSAEQIISSLKNDVLLLLLCN